MACNPSNPHGKEKKARWVFEEVIIDNNPLQPSRITDMAVVDIDNDGLKDLWFSGRGINLEERKFAWYKNTSDPHHWERFTPFKGSSIGSAWGDVDGDGDMDLITGRERDEHPMVWMENPLPNGDPEKDPWSVYVIHPDPADPDEVLASFVNRNGKRVWHLDMNGDTRLDLIIAAFKFTLWFVPGPEDPKKGQWKFYKITESPDRHGEAEVADLDNDGDLDVIWGRDWYENQGNPTAIPWRRHEIDPNWTNEAQIVATDLDGDGWLDIILSGEETNHGIAWYRNPGAGGTGHWQKHIVVQGWEKLHSLDAGDVDNDGDIDIFTAQMHTSKEKRVAIWENVDLQANRWKPHIISNVGSHKAKLFDIDGDGDLDVVGKNFDGDKRPRVWFNPNGPAPGFTKFGRWRRIVIDPKNAPQWHIRYGDLNGDRLVDIVTGTGWYKNPGRPDGKWIRTELGKAVKNTLLVYDFDQDGDIDVLGEGFVWCRNDGKGRFTLVDNIKPRGGFIQGAEAGQLDDDPEPEIAFTYKNGDGIYIMEVPPDPSRIEWTAHKIYAWDGLTKDVALGDIDRDGDTDILFCGRDGRYIEWLRNDGNAWTSMRIAPPPVNINHRCKLADLNGDARLDAVIGNKGRLLTWYEQPANLDSEWTEHIIADRSLLNFDPLSLDITDMDKDGDLDIITGEHTPNIRRIDRCSLYIFENANGQGTKWHRHIVYSGDEHHQGTQVVDIDGDGDWDIISVGFRHTKVLLYENKAVSN